MHTRTSFTRPTAAVERLEVRTLFSFVPAPGVAPVVDNDGNSYVLGSDGPLMAVRRFTPDGEPDSAWAPDGVYNLSTFQGGSPDGQINEVDVPRAITIDAAHKTLFVAGSTDDQWAVARINIPWGDTGWSWHAHFLTGTAEALWVDSSQDHVRLGVAGTSAAGETQVAVLYAYDTPAPPGDPVHTYSGGTFDKSFGGGTGYATAPAPPVAAPAALPVAASSLALMDLNSLPLIKPAAGADEWLVQRTVTSAGPGGATLTRKSVVGFLPDGTLSTRFANNKGVALFTLWGDRGIAPGGHLRPSRVRDAVPGLAQPAALW